MIAAQELSEDYLTRSQAARVIGVSDNMVTVLWREGQLPYVKTPLGRLVSVEDVEAYRVKREARKNERND